MTLLLATLALANAAPQLLQTGEFHAAELPRDLDGPWLALVETDSGSALRETTLRRSEHDGLVTLTASEPALLLLRGTELSPGPLVSWKIEVGFLPPGESIALGATTLVASGAVVDDVLEPGVVGYELRLEGEVEQTLLHFDLLEREGQPTLIWAGDLDGDGALDLVLDHSGWDEVSLLVLHMSGATEDQQRLLPVARSRRTRPIATQG